MPIIQVENLTKEFKIKKRKPGIMGAISSLVKTEYITKTAVNGISFEIEKGETVAYIGMNGAGKSTTIKMLVGILNPTSGSVRVNQIEPYKERKENAKKIGVVFGQRTQLWWDLPVQESFKLIAGIYKVSESQFKKNMEVLNDILNIDKFIDTPTRQLSLGQRMRADICAAFLHNPEIVYLDEPTIGLDVIAKRQIQNFISEINKKYNTTIILTTHDMSDIEKICKRVIIIDEGEILFDGALENLKNAYELSNELIIETDESDIDPSRFKNEKTESIKVVDNKLCIQFKGSVKPIQIVEELMKECKIIDFQLKENRLEDLIHKIYSGKA